MGVSGRSCHHLGISELHRIRHLMLLQSLGQNKRFKVDTSLRTSESRCRLHRTGIQSTRPRAAPTKALLAANELAGEHGLAFRDEGNYENRKSHAE